MDKLGIYNMALDLCGQAPMERLHNASNDKDQTERTLDTWFMTALRKASHELSWPFLEVVLSFSGGDLGPGHGYMHSFEFSDDVEQLTWANGDRFRRIGNILYTDESEPEAWGIQKDIVFPDDSYPEAFSDLVALALAFYASTRLSPDTNTRNTIYALYKDRLNELRDHYLQAERHGSEDIYG